MIVIGLGNPGARYAPTRHNAGYMVVDAVAASLGVRMRKAWFRPYLLGRPAGERAGEVLVKPLTFMNRSGEILADLFRRTRSGAAELLVVHDNVDLPPGACRLKLGGSGGGGHRGLESIRAALGGADYMRLSVGVGRPDGGGELAAWVLSPPSSEEEAARFREGVSRAAGAVLRLFAEDPVKVMNELNRKDGSAAG